MLRQRREARQERRAELRLGSTVDHDHDRERAVAFGLPEEDRDGLPVERSEAMQVGLAQRTEVEGTRQLGRAPQLTPGEDRKSTRLNSSHRTISYAGFCLKKKIFNSFVFFLSNKKFNQNVVSMWVVSY